MAPSPIKKIIFVLLLICASGVHTAYAVPVLPEMDTKALSFEEMLLDLDNVDLRRVVELYQSDQQGEAKTRLIAILRADPSDPQALDVAGSIYLWENRLKEAEVAFEASLVGRKKAGVMAKLGVVRLRTDDKAKAERIFKTALSLDADNYIALRYLAWIAQTNVDTEAAIFYLRRLTRLPLKINGNLNENHLALAEMYDENRQAQQCANLLSPYSKDLESNSVLATASSILLAKAYTEIGELAESTAIIARLREQDKANVAALDIVELHLIGMRDGVKQAEKNASKLLVLYPDQSNKIHLALARVYAQSGDLENTSKELQLIADNFANSGDADNLNTILRDLVVTLIDQQLNNKALTLLERYHEKFPTQPAIFYQLAEVQFITGRKAAAKKSVTKILSQQPGFTQAHLLAGHIALDAKDFAVAKQHFLKATKLDPFNINAWTKLASTSVMATGRYNEAQLIIVEGLKANPKNPRLMFELAELYYEDQPLEVAITQYKNIVQAHPSYLPAIDNLASILFDENQELKLAQQLAERAYQIGGGDPHIKILYGRSLIHAGKNKEAIAVLSTAAQAITDDGQSHYYLAKALGADRQNNRAKAELLIASKKGVDESTKTKMTELLKTL